MYSSVGAPGGLTYTITADSAGAVAESDEANNVATGQVQTTTLPTCTPTATSTATVPPTVTPSGYPHGHGVFTNFSGGPINTATVTMVEVSFNATGMYVSSNAPGCGAPSLISETYSNTGGPVPGRQYTTITVIQWPTPCVDPGETFAVDYASVFFMSGAPTAVLSNEALQSTATPTSTPTSVPTATATAALPDLVVLSISDRQQGAAGCNTPAGLRIVVQNVKAGAAGASTLSVSAASGPSEDVGIPALAGNSTVTLFSGVTGIPFSDTYTAVADSGGAVVEADEANNTTAATIALATTATCTPSPTPGANTPTVTPTPTGFTTQDTDGDGLPGNADNCPFVYNPDQANSDRNLISNHPVYAVDDHTLINSDGIGDACDVDVDNDGLIDGDEASGLACPAASGPTNADSIDTDHDGFKDGYECGVGTDPANAASRPPPPSPGTDADNDHLSDAEETSIGTDPNNADSDGDGLQDGWEVRGYASSPLSIDSDGDGTRDGCEAASLNADTVVNVGDQAMMAAEVMRPAPASQKLANFDLNKDGVLNPGDQAFQASRIGAGKCP